MRSSSIFILFCLCVLPAICRDSESIADPRTYQDELISLRLTVSREDLTEFYIQFHKHGYYSFYGPISPQTFPTAQKLLLFVVADQQGIRVLEGQSHFKALSFEPSSTMKVILNPSLSPAIDQMSLMSYTFRDQTSSKQISFSLGHHASTRRQLAVMSYGNVDNLTKPNSFSDSRVDIGVQVNGTHMTVLATYKSYGYFSILLSDSMSRGDYHVFQILSGSVSIKDYYSPGGHSTPVPDPVDDLNIIGYSTDQSTYFTVKYSRLLNTGDSHDTSLSVGQAFAFTYAVRKGSLALAEHRSGQYISFSGNLLADGSITNQSDSAESGIDKVLLHGIILTLAWTLVIDIGVWVKFLYKFKYRLLLHGFLCFAGVVASVIEISIFVNSWRKDGADNNTVNDNRMLAHLVIGLIMLAWVIIQTLTGLWSRLIIMSDSAHPKLIQSIRTFHRVSGYVLLLLGKANVLLGWILYDKTVAFIVVLIECILVLILSSIMVWYNKLPAKSQAKVSAKSQAYNELLRLPYNSPNVQKENIFVFDDKVYKLRTIDDFHPGGKRISLLSNGREIDRFIFGAYHMEQYPQLKGFTHPKAAMSILGNPVAILPNNLMYTLPQGKFRASLVFSLASNLNIYYFKSQLGQASFNDISDLKHVGQYFTVQAFGKTRLYTCVACLRLSALQKRGQLLTRLNFPNTSASWQQIHSKKATGINTQNLLPTPTSEAFNEIRNGNSSKQLVPLLIKSYDFPGGFTSTLARQYADAQFKIRGLRGRGLCLDAIPRGNVVIFVGGTGIYPFLDLIQTLFWIAASKVTSLGSDAQVFQARKKSIEGLNFTIYGSFDHPRDLVLTSELKFLESSGLSSFRALYRFKENPAGFSSVLGSDIRFDKRFTQSLGDVLHRDLSMVYVCGPPRMYKEVLDGLESMGLPKDKVFIV